MRKLLRMLGRMGLVLIGVAMALALAEAGFHVYYFFHPSKAKGFFWVPNTEYGWGLAPGREAPYYEDHGEFSTRVRINSQGLRDVEHRYTKPPGTYRILVLGDSYMEALQVKLEEIFPRLLEAHLAASAAKPVEVINTGVSAWGTDNEYLFFRREGYRYQPDLVLLVFTTCNDIRENYEPYNRMVVGANLGKPNFTVNGAGLLEQHNGEPPSPPVPWWREHMYVGQFLYVQLGGRLVLPGTKQVGIPPPKDPKAPWIPPNMFVYNPEYRQEVEEAWRVTRALILAIRDEATAHKAKFAVVVHNGPWVYYEDRWDFMFMRDSNARATWDRRKPDRLASEFLSAEHIPFVNLFDAFDAAKNQGPLFFHVDPHWTPAGHRVAAQTVAEFLIREGLAPTR